MEKDPRPPQEKLLFYYQRVMNALIDEGMLTDSVTKRV